MGNWSSSNGILDFGLRRERSVERFWIDEARVANLRRHIECRPHGSSAFLGILDFGLRRERSVERLTIGSTVYTGGLYHQGMIGQ